MQRQQAAGHLAALVAWIVQIHVAEDVEAVGHFHRFDFVATHRGMFSRLGLAPEQVAALRDRHGIYMVGDSRVNIAALPTEKLETLAKAMVAVGA